MRCQRKIFILSDDKFSASVYRELFERRGYDVFVTTNAYQLLLYAKEIVPDLFIFDENKVPFFSSEVLNVIRNNKKLSSIPCIVTSVYEASQKSFSDPMVHFLLKPAHTEVLYDLVSSYCLAAEKSEAFLWDSSLKESRKKSRVSLS